MPDIWEVAALLAKLMLYIGFVGAAGLVLVNCLYSDLVKPVRLMMKRQAMTLACLAIVAAITGFMLGAAALTGSVEGLVDPEMLGLLWQTSAGDALVYRLAGAVLILVGLSLPRVGNWIALPGGALALWSFAQIGHVLQMDYLYVQLLLFLHLLCIAFWLGIFSPLRALALRPECIEDAAALGRRFGQAAALAVPVLIAAGLWMSWLLVGTVQGLVSTGYGRALLVKVLLVGCLLTLAAANKLRFVPALRNRDAKAGHHLARSIEVEVIVGLAVLATTATLTTMLTPPN